MSQTPTTIQDAQKLLHEQLRSLSATGADGFEGFMAKALTELTGQAFHVAKSSHQGGSDARSDPCNFFRVGVEGKNYGSTSLQLDALKSKLTDASTEKTPVDLWILAATGPMDISNREKLDAHGEACGIGVVVLDWPKNLAHVCDLAVICAAATQTSQRFLNSSKPLVGALELIRQAPEFESVHQRVLQRLTRADTGYESTRREVERWVTEAQATLANARSRLGGQHNLGKSEYGVIPRATINTRLDSWYTSNQGMAALLGDEGMGKSWAALDWHNRLKSSETGAPLTIFLPAKRIDGSDVKSTLAKALYDQTGIRSVAFWEKRLALWERHGGESVRILIVLDGLNQNFQFRKWADWLQPLFEDRLNGMYRVIVSCWPNWWHDSLANLANLTPNPLEISVKGYNDYELDILLRTMDVEQLEFEPAVLNLMRVPRLSSLVATHRDRLKGMGDVTAEQVIYEDWKDRLADHGVVAGLTDSEMQSFVAELGEKLKLDVAKATVTRKDVIESLSKESGKSSIELVPAITELSSGAWLKPGARPNTFRVVAERIPFVLGITLLSKIRQVTQAAALEAGIAEFLDPLKAHSLGAAILRATMTVALVEPDTSLVLRQTLLRQWVDHENFQVDDFRAFWRIAGFDPDLFLDLAEERWLSSTGTYFSDEVMIKAFANAADFAEFQAALKERLEKWLGTAWPDSKVGAVLGTVDQTGEDSRQRVAATLARHRGWVSDDNAKSFAPVGLDSTNKHWSWLCARALAILSYAKRAPFASALEAWALSRAIMNWEWAQHEDEVAWILRLNPEDASETAEAVQIIITRLKAQQDPICEQAAGYLTATMSHIERASEPLVVDEAPEENSPTLLDVTGMDATGLYEATKRYLSPSGWKNHDPENGAFLVNRLIERGLDGNESALNLILQDLDHLLVVLTPDSRNRLIEALSTKRKAVENDSEANQQVIAGLQAASRTLQLYGAGPADQSALVLSNGFDAGRNEKSLQFCRPITLHHIANTDLENAPASNLADWLDYVNASLPCEEIVRLDFLPDLITHDDQRIRHSALSLAACCRHMPALEAFAASPYSASPSADAKPEREHEYWRHRALLELCEFSPDAFMIRRLSPESTALVAEHKPNDSEALVRFSDYLQGEFEAITTASSWSTGRYWCSYRKAIEALVEHDSAGIVGWLIPWLENVTATSIRKALMNHFPVVDTMRALSMKAPEVSLKLYEALIDPSNRSIFSTGDILLFPLEMPSSARVDDLCDQLLANATTDKALLEIVCASNKHERLDWLFGWVQSLESGRMPADVAKAYTLLGLCDVSNRAEETWKVFLTRPPLHAWLNDVMKKSLQDYTGNRTARNALANFWSSNSPSAARHELQRLEDNCDLRTEIWFDDFLPEQRNRPYERNLALNLSITALNQAIKKNGDRRQKGLYHTPLAFSIMAPWKQ